MALIHSPVVEYVTEEVSRQGHDVTQLDGIERVGWMLDAWSYALRCQHWATPTVDDAIVLGKLVEPRKNRLGVRACDVRVGSRACPPHERVNFLLVQLFEELPVWGMDALAFYKAFEEIHPFVDGNGRTGKVLLNWLSGTLLNPIFPPSDLWGVPIRNP